MKLSLSCGDSAAVVALVLSDNSDFIVNDIVLYENNCCGEKKAYKLTNLPTVITRLLKSVLLIRNK